MVARMRKIKLTQGQYALVDDEDFERLNKYSWYAFKISYGTRYRAARHNPQRKNGGAPLLFMDRILVKARKGQDVDHINGNTLDNRKANLRRCSRSQNLCNKGKKSGCSSKHKGVHFFKRTGTWQTYIWVKRKRIWLGYFKDEIEAAKAYNNAAKKYHGKFARLNKI